MALIQNPYTGDDPIDDTDPGWPVYPADHHEGEERTGLTSTELAYCDRVADRWERRRW